MKKKMYGKRRARLIAVIAALAAAVVGIAARGTSSRGQLTVPCCTAGTPAIGILVGSSPADHDLHQAGAWGADAKMVAAVAGRARAHVVLDRIGSGPGSSDVLYNARVSSGNGQNFLVSRTQLEHAEMAMVQAFGNEQATTTPGRTDVISGVRRMEDHLGAFHHAKTVNVVIFGNAVQTAGPVDLADPVQLADPATALQAVAAQGLLPRNSCAGWRVHMVDGSLTPAGGLGALQDEQLREFWREFFARCGGRLVLWDSTLIAFPASGQVGPASWAAPGHRQVIVPLPASVLFELDQAVLLPRAGQILGELCHDLTSTYPTATAKIAGYTSPDGTAGYNMALSRARAQAVADWLEAHGVSASRLTVHGYGDTQQIPGGLAVNRRVIVTLHVG